MEKLLYTKVRDVKRPTRANLGDAGIDFYVPKLTWDDLVSINVNKVQSNLGSIVYDSVEDSVVIEHGGRILIPSGIRVLIEPRESMLMAANKSGISTKSGLLYTAEVVDSPYTGEMHIGVYNSGIEPVRIKLNTGTKLMQFVHVPIIPSIPLEITSSQYEELEDGWGSRGANGFGSSDKK